MDIDEEKIATLLYRHRHMKDNVAELRREFNNPRGFLGSVNKVLIKKKGMMLRKKVEVYEEVLNLLGIPFEAMGQGLDIE